MITVLIADDHALLRDMLSRRLDDEADIAVLAAVPSTDEAIEAGRSLRPDVVIIDIDITGVSAFEAAKTIQQTSLHTRVIFLSAYVNDGYIQRALEVEASGYLAKSEKPEAVVQAVRSVASGFTCFSPEVRSRLVVTEDGAQLVDRLRTRGQLLTDREREVLVCLARGMSKKEVARTLGISVKTVDAHAAHVMAKLDVHDRVKLARYAVREGLINP